MFQSWRWAPLGTKNSKIKNTLCSKTEFNATENQNSRIQAAVRALGPRRESVSLPVWLSHSPRWS